VHITSLIIILTSNYYRSMKINTEIGVKGRMYGLPGLQLAMIGICVLLSILLLVIDLRMFILRYRMHKKMNKI
jgi:hypothetical protein